MVYMLRTVAESYQWNLNSDSDSSLSTTDLLVIL